MSWGPVLLCCWPGLPGLWLRGRWASLLLAVVFTIVLNLAIVSSFVWTGIFQDKAILALSWPMILVFWAATGWMSFQNLPDLMSVKSAAQLTVLDSSDALFIDARREYLKGHWDAAETLLQRQLKRTPRDVESRLLLATLFRHTRRFDAAHQQLENLELFDESVAWKSEVLRERRLLELIIEYENSPPEGAEDEGYMTNDGYVPAA